jgi:large subunit ribosomal protein L17
MRHRIDGYKLGRLTKHRNAMFRNLLISLFRYERITTTEAKAKAVRGLADHCVTLAKREDNRLHARRQVLTLVPDRDVVARLFDTVAARYSERNGGYTRILKAGPRPGDAAPMVLLELVDRVEPGTDGKGKKREKKEKPPRGEAKSESGRKRKRKEAAAAR